MLITLPKRIVLCGVSHSGKSTLGDNLQRHFGHICTAFADPLKRAAQAIFGFQDDHLWGTSHTRDTPYPAFEFSGWCFPCQAPCVGPERHAHGAPLDTQPEDTHDWWRCDLCGTFYDRYVTPREVLKTLGTEWGRRFCTNVWADACFFKMRPSLSYVVTDGRFRNERNAAVHHRACVVLLERGLATSTSTHASEAEVREMAQDRSLFDVVLDNTEGSAEANFEKLVTLLAGLRGAAGTRSLIEWHRYEDRLRGLVCTGD
jgi:hypothetical protein